MNAAVAIMFIAGLLSVGDAPPHQDCGSMINEIELYRELAKDPHFSTGFPPPGKIVGVEPNFCGYRVYVGAGSADSLGGDVYIIDEKGRILDIIYGY